MTTLEQSLSRRIDGLEYRVSSLEENVGEVREEVGSSHDLEVEALRAQIVEAKAKQSDARKLAAEQSTWLQRHGVTAITSALVAFLVAGCNAIASYVATHIK